MLLIKMMPHDGGVVIALLLQPLSSILHLISVCALASQTALHHPTPSRQRELWHYEIRAPMLSQKQGRLQQDLQDPLPQSGKYVRHCLSAAHTTQKKQLSSGSSAGEASISGVEQGESVEGFNTRSHTHIQTSRNGNLQIPKTPHGVCCVIIEHTNYFLHQRLFVSWSSFDLNLFISFRITLGFTTNTKADRTLSIIG